MEEVAEQRQPLLDNDHIALEIESSVPDVEMESVLGTGGQQQQNLSLSSSKRNHRQKGVNYSCFGVLMGDGFLKNTKI